MSAFNLSDTAEGLGQLRPETLGVPPECLMLQAHGSMWPDVRRTWKSGYGVKALRRADL